SGGTMSGVFSVTEAGGAAVAYAPICGLIACRYTTGSGYRLLLASGVTLASGPIALTGASLFGHVLVASVFARAALGVFVGVTENPKVEILMIFLLLAILAMFFETVSARILI
ncbi:TRAP transporter large permease subunit, partial [Rhodovulum sulfidophilum]|uniref:TRAP transporter large permease subunit n=1 Tax=Rhodovulum sulfidophilum TaxID=35806 RepID=UPI001924519E|nr:TRAP transporter large permease subunit [Rhodovulum sulfidophilum]